MRKLSPELFIYDRKGAAGRQVVIRSRLKNQVQVLIGKAWDGPGGNGGWIGSEGQLSDKGFSKRRQSGSEYLKSIPFFLFVLYIVGDFDKSLVPFLPSPSPPIILKRD